MTDTDKIAAEAWTQIGTYLAGCVLDQSDEGEADKDIMCINFIKVAIEKATKVMQQHIDALDLVVQSRAAHASEQK